MARLHWQHESVVVDAHRLSVGVPLDADGITGLERILESRLGRSFGDGSVRVTDGYLRILDVDAECELAWIRRRVERVLEDLARDAGRGWTAGDEFEREFWRSLASEQDG